MIPFRRTIGLMVILVLGVIPGPCPAGEDSPCVVSLVDSVRLPDSLYFLGSPVPVQDQDIRERLEKELLLALWDRPQVILWLKRSSAYFPHLETMLREEGLPDDLKYVTVVESGLRAHAGSSDGAIGFWQFVSSTGRNNGLTIDSAMDDRRNLFKSTRAACRYLKDLYGRFQSWPLALAAYNMGEYGLEKEMERQEVKDYYALYLPLETQRYIFKIIAAKLIMESPESYCFRLSGEDYYPLLAFDTVTVDIPALLPLTLVAKAAGTTFKEIKDLNPEIRGYHLEKGRHAILVPRGRGKAFGRTFPGLLTEWTRNNDTRLHVVKRGESLSGIASSYKVSLSSLLLWNNLRLSSTIHPGEVLVVQPD